MYPPIQVTVNADYYIKVHWVGASIGQGNIFTSSTFGITGGSSLIKIPTYIAVSPNNVGVRDAERSWYFPASWKQSNGVFSELDGNLVQKHSNRPRKT